MLHYNTESKVYYEVKHGMYDCLDRLVGNIDEINKIYAQIESFKSKSGFSGNLIVKFALNQNSGTMVEIVWW